MYRVFLGAPTTADIQNDPSSYSWHTVSSGRTLSSKPTQSVAVLPRATLEAASLRISLIYKDVVFSDNPEEESFVSDQSESLDDVEVSVFRGEDKTTLISWPPTRPEDDNDASREDDSSREIPSFLVDTSSESISKMLEKSSSQAQGSAAAVESQIIETQVFESQSLNYSDASSIGRFPSFHFNLHTLTSMTHLAGAKFTASVKINILLAVLEVEGFDTVRIKKGVDAGKEVSILKMILGDEEGKICKLTAWREIAEQWGGSGKSVATKRGDIVHIENVMASREPSSAIALTASPNVKSRMVICYRTMPYTHEDGRLRPDLRLGISDPAVRKVASVVLWFERMAGLSLS